MFFKIALALLFKKSKYWLMPLFVVIFSSFLLFEQCSAFHSVRRELDGLCKKGDLWIMGEKLSVDELLKVRRLQDVAIANFVDGHMSIKALQWANLGALKAKIEKATGRKALTRKEFSKELFQIQLRDNRAVSLFSLSVASGLLLALGIFGATFYYFFKRELVNYSVFKAVGATPAFLTSLLTFQALVLALMGWTIAICLYIGLAQLSKLFAPLSWSIVGLTLVPLLMISLGTGVFVSFTIKGIE